MIRTRVLSLPRRAKQGVVGVVDVCLAALALWLAFAFRTETVQWPQLSHGWVYVLAAGLSVPVFVRNGLYRAVFRYSGMAAMLALAKSVGTYAVLFAAVLWLWAPVGVPRSVGLLQPVFFLLLAGGVRVLARQWLSAQSASMRSREPVKRLVIYGAGAAGVQIAMALSRAHEFELAAFADDDQAVQGRSINGVNVYSPLELPELIKSQGVTDLLLAMPSISRERRLEILNQLEKLPVHVRSLPALADLAHGKIAVSDIKELDIEDLLGRATVDPDPGLLPHAIAGQTVLVTGAGGSIGGELCRQILSLAPDKLVLLEHSEFGLYAIHRELEQLRERMGVAVVLCPVLCNVQNETKVMEVFKNHRPSLVYHAAAYKHVPLVECNPAEGVANNVFGTLNVARAALVVQCKAVVLISTDKAVRPTNVMGASKRLAELVLQALAGVKALRATDGAAAMRRVDDMMSTQTRMVYPNRTTFSMVRFGNVLGSSGSVVPLFREQIAHGGPITLTDAKVTRYFMTIPEAVHLVLQAGAMAKGGEVFVLDMGQPVRIFDLARRMVELSGLTLRNASNPGGDIEIKVTGLRPGEKLYEELLIGNDPQRTAHPRIMMAHEKMVPWDELLPKLTELSRAANTQNIAHIRDVLLELVDGFTPGELIAQPYADSGFDNNNGSTGTHP